MASKHKGPAEKPADPRPTGKVEWRLGSHGSLTVTNIGDGDPADAPELLTDARSLRAKAEVACSVEAFRESVERAASRLTTAQAALDELKRSHSLNHGEYDRVQREVTVAEREINALRPQGAARFAEIRAACKSLEPAAFAITKLCSDELSRIDGEIVRVLTPLLRRRAAVRTVESMARNIVTNALSAAAGQLTTFQRTGAFSNPPPILNRHNSRDTRVADVVNRSSESAKPRRFKPLATFAGA